MLRLARWIVTEIVPVDFSGLSVVGEMQALKQGKKKGAEKIMPPLTAPGLTNG